MLDEFQDALVFFANNGQGVKLEGLATFLPKIKVDGKLNLSVRMNREISNRLNQDGAFKGEILNRENIGKTSDDLVALWNEAYPEDLVSQQSFKQAGNFLKVDCLPGNIEFVGKKIGFVGMK